MEQNSAPPSSPPITSTVQSIFGSTTTIPTFPFTAGSSVLRPESFPSGFRPTTSPLFPLYGSTTQPAITGVYGSTTPPVNQGSPFTIHRPTAAPVMSTPVSLPPTTSVKLDRDNYLVWKYTILPVIRSHRLENHIRDDLPRPTEFLTYNGPGGAVQMSNVQNPAYLDWKLTDDALMAWLLQTMTPTAVTDLLGNETPAQVWKFLETSYNSRSAARLLELKTAMSTTEKGTKSVADYLAQMKSYADNLAAADHPVPLADLILDTLRGLDRNYESVTVNMTSRIGLLTWPEVQFQLLNHERYLARLSGSSLLETTPTANVAMRNPYRGQNHASTSRGSRGQSRGGRNRGRGGRTTSGRTGPPNPGVQCQVCGKMGHSALICWYRFDEEYNSSPASSAGNSNNHQYHGHQGSTSQQQQQHNSPKQVSAYIATPQTVGDTSWFMDSGASNHVTNDLNNLHLSSNYAGSEYRDDTTHRSAA